MLSTPRQDARKRKRKRSNECNADGDARYYCHMLLKKLRGSLATNLLLIWCSGIVQCSERTDKKASDDERTVIQNPNKDQKQNQSSKYAFQ